MIQPLAWFRRSIRVPMLLTLCLVSGGSGCDDGTVRGAGSIDLPEDSLKKFPTAGPSRRAPKPKPAAVRPN
jgi:hypothetical protein